MIWRPEDIKETNFDSRLGQTCKNFVIRDALNQWFKKSGQTFNDRQITHRHSLIRSYPVSLHDICTLIFINFLVSVVGRPYAEDNLQWTLVSGCAATNTVLVNFVRCFLKLQLTGYVKYAGLWTLGFVISFVFWKKSITGLECICANKSQIIVVWSLHLSSLWISCIQMSFNLTLKWRERERELGYAFKCWVNCEEVIILMGRKGIYKDVIRWPYWRLYTNQYSR